MRVVADMDVMGFLDSDVGPKRCGEGHWCCARAGGHMHVVDDPKACARCRERLTVEIP